MNNLSSLFPDDFQTSEDAWKKTLLSELKLTEIESKLTKNTLEGIFSILSLEANAQVIPSNTAWKKTSQTYILPTNDDLHFLDEDLQNGVRTFFFVGNTFSKSHMLNCLKKLESHQDASMIEVVYLSSGVPEFKSTLKLHYADAGVMALDIASNGGTHLQELAALLVQVIRWSENNPTATALNVFVTTDNHFFQSMAKIRALKEATTKIFTELKRNVQVQVVSLVNTRDWTLYERYNNMLRNTVAVAAAQIGGADLIQTLGYMAPFDAEAPVQDKEHQERARRMARNTAHILSLESMLGMVQDAAAGSYHLEGLTNFYAEKSWELMQNLVVLGQDEYFKFWQLELQQIQTERLKQFNHRKLILSGVNDFPNIKETLNIKLNEVKGFRLSRQFETLRLRVEALKPTQKKNVRLVFWGDYAGLNARLNFTKNYFELLGLNVHEPHQSIEDEAKLSAWLKLGTSDEIIVLCAKDEDYAGLSQKVKRSTVANFVAGKVTLEHFTSVYGGQNVYQVLSTLVEELEGLA